MNDILFKICYFLSIYEILQIIIGKRFPKKYLGCKYGKVLLFLSISFNYYYKKESEKIKCEEKSREVLL